MTVPSGSRAGVEVVNKVTLTLIELQQPTLKIDQLKRRPIIPWKGGQLNCSPSPHRT